MKKLLSKVMVVVLALSMFITLPNGNVTKAATTDKQLDGILEVTTKKLLENIPSPEVGSVGGEWTIVGLSRSNEVVSQEYYNEYYKKVETNVKEEMGKSKPYRKITDVQRIVLALTAIGKDPTNVAGYNLIDMIWQRENLGFQGLNGYVFALLALDTKGYEEPKDAINTRDNMIKSIFKYKTEDGGFSLEAGGKKADPDMTAMTLQALSSYKDRDDVKEVIESSLKILSELQNDKGGYSSWGSDNVESAAQVLTALTSLGLNPMDKDLGFVKETGDLISNIYSFYDGDGGFKHIQNSGTNAMATEQALYSLVSYQRLLEGKTRLYDMSDVISESNYESQVKDINNRILILSNLERLTLDNKEEILSLLSKYDGLKDYYKEQVNDIDKLNEMKEKIIELDAKVKSLNDDILNIVKSSEITLDKKDDILGIVNRYEKLSNEDKKYVNNYDDVLHALDVIKDLENNKTEENTTIDSNNEETNVGEDTTVPDGNTTTAKTGDNNNIVQFMTITLLAGAILVLSRKRLGEKEAK